MSPQPLAIDIHPGDYAPYWHVFGFTLNGNTITGTIIAGAIIVAIGLFLRRNISATKPTKSQLAFEAMTSEVEREVEHSTGIKTAPWVVPFALTIFFFLLIANWISIIPSGHGPEYISPPAADVNLTYALALLVFFTMHIAGVRKRGLRGYYGHLFRKPRILIPLNILEELIKPLTLSLRLFGNIFAGTIMVALIAALPVYVLWAPDIIWKLFDMFIGLIQAFIFALLSIIYLGSIRPAEEGAHH